jgi:hypothetical protein
MRSQGRIHAHLHAVPSRGDSVHRINYRNLFLHRQQPIQLVEEIVETLIGRDAPIPPSPIGAVTS